MRITDKPFGEVVHCGATPSDEVLGLAARGWRLLPCRTDKTPYLKQWPETASRDAATIRAWWMKYAGCNWGVLTGADSGVWVLDVDGKEGEENLRRLCHEYGHLPDTLVAETGKGFHLYFRYPSNLKVVTRAGRLAQGLDVRGEDGYVIAPPSVHPSGKQYHWIDPAALVSDAPNWLLKLVAAAPGGGTDRLGAERKRLPSPRTDGESTESLESIFAKYAPNSIRETTRNTTLASIAGTLRRRGYELAQIEHALLQVNEVCCENPLPESEVIRIARSIAALPAGPEAFSDAPLEEYVEIAIDDNRRLYGTKRGQRYRSPLFHLVRSLKSRVEFAGDDALTVAEHMDSILSQLSDQAEPWEHFFGDLSADPRTEFVAAWETVKTAANEGALVTASREANRLPLKPLRSLSPKYERFISIAGHLQLVRPDEMIMLPVVPLGKMLACDPSMVSNYLRHAQRAGFLQLVEEADHRQQKAAKYMFSLERFDWASGHEL